jgi:hypothetical protein
LWIIDVKDHFTAAFYLPCVGQLIWKNGKVPEKDTNLVTITDKRDHKMLYLVYPTTHAGIKLPESAVLDTDCNGKFD